MSSAHNTTIRAARGFSLVELLVAMVIGLLGTIIIFQVFNASEGVRRTTSSGGDVQQTGAIALYAIEHDLRNAGMGFSDTQNAGCTVQVWDRYLTPSPPPPYSYTFKLQPVLITPGADAKHADTIRILYGSQPLIVSSTPLGANFDHPNNKLNVSSSFGWRTGDMLVLLQPPVGTSDCILIEVTGPSDVEKQPDKVEHTPPARFNPPGGFSGYTYTGVGTSNVAVVYNLGNYQHADSVPVLNTYSISGNTLQYTSTFSASPLTALAVADSIVHMRAQYVMNDGTYTTPDAAAPDWSKVVAVRLAVVARSSLPEKAKAAVTTPGTPMPCDTTATAPTWSGSGLSGGSFDLSLDPNWQCYRYRVFETTVPLRNWVWSNS
jgi:type IV pilus assembly protein PilW